MTDPMTSWDADLRAAVRRLRDEGGRRAVVGPVEGPSGPWAAFRPAGSGCLVVESDAGRSRELPEEDALRGAADALSTWGLVGADPLTCFLEGVDRDPARDDPYNPRVVLKALGRARRRRRSVSLVYEAASGTVVLDVRFRKWRSAELTVVAPKPVNAAQARRLRELDLHGSAAHWSGLFPAAPDAVEAVVPLIWSRTRDVRVQLTAASPASPTGQHDPSARDEP
jgi:hypothetical protein